MGMEKYMGYRTEAVQRPERLLPEINIAGTLFVADIQKMEFREAGNPQNRMPIIGAKEEMGFSHFFFDKNTKNHYTGEVTMPDGIPSHVTIVLLQPLKEIDPVGLARMHGFRDDYYGGPKAANAELVSFSRESSKQQKEQQQGQEPAVRKVKRQRL